MRQGSIKCKSMFGMEETKNIITTTIISGSSFRNVMVFGGEEEVDEVVMVVVVIIIIMADKRNLIDYRDRKMVNDTHFFLLSLFPCCFRISSGAINGVSSLQYHSLCCQLLSSSSPLN